jgi:alpha-galactosidase
MMKLAQENERTWRWAGPGGWNDPDMLEVGNGGMTYEEYKTHFSLWCIMKAPLLIGCDLTKASKETLEILSNTEAIAVNQDAMGVQGHRVWSDKGGNIEVEGDVPEGDLEVWAGPLMSGDFAVLLLNRSGEEREISADFKDCGMRENTKAAVRDIWKHADVGTFDGSYSATIPSHGVQFLIVTPILNLILCFIKV